MNAYSGFVSFGHIDTTGADSENSACLISIILRFVCKDRKKDGLTKRQSTFFMNVLSIMRYIPAKT